MRTAQDTIERAFEACRRIEQRLPRETALAISPLISWSAFHLGSGLVALAISDGLETDEGWRSLSRQLNVNAYDALEATSFTLACTSTTSALDLCASAVYRLAGGMPRPNREADLSQWRRLRRLANVSPPPALDRWATDVLAAPEWRSLENARHQMVHRTTPREIDLVIGGGHYRRTTYEVGKARYRVDYAVSSFVDFGQRRFETFCTAVLSDFP